MKDKLREIAAKAAADADRHPDFRLSYQRGHALSGTTTFTVNLPVENNLWRSLGLLFEFAFSPSAIEAEMERRAEFASLALSPHPEIVLAHIADFLGDPTLRSPHHQGFGELGRELTVALQRVGVAAELAVPSRWHQVPMAKVQEAARLLLGQLP